MNFAKQVEKKFEIVATDDPTLVGFKVALNSEFLVPSGMPAFASAYSDWVYKNPVRSTEWGSYVYVRNEETQNETWFHFIPSLPSSVRTSERIDPIWGVVTIYEYEQNTTNVALPVVSVDLSTYKSGLTGFCLDAQEQILAKGLSKYRIESVTSLSKTINEDIVDEEFGTKIDVTKLYTLSANDLTGSDVSVLTGIATEATRVSHNIWLQTSKKIIGGLGIGLANAQVWESHEKIYWPPVMTNPRFTNVLLNLTNDVTVNKWKKLLSYQLREAYTGEVKCTNSLYWESLASAATVADPDEMIASSIDVDGNLMSIHIRECLHPSFSYSEQNATATGWTTGGLVTGFEVQMITWSYDATQPTDWPATITRYTKTFYKGGVKVLKQVFERPTTYATSVVNLSSEPWTYSDGYWYLQD